MINFEKFTNYSQEIIFASNAKKDFYKNTEIQPEHIILAMIEDKGIAKDYLEELKLLNQHFINEIVAKIMISRLNQGKTLAIFNKLCVFNKN